MKSKSCEVDHLESDVLLPPRKRLLAGLKRQNSDVNSPGSSVSNCSPNKFEMTTNHLFRSFTSNPDLSNEKIIETSRNEALKAIKFAEAARATAEEKAAKAVKAVAAARSALELVAAISEETDTIDTYLKKIKLNKNVFVQTLHGKQKGAQNCRNDEELARNLHRAMNSSGRISKNSSTVEMSSHKPKTLSPSKKPKLCSGVTTTKGDQSSMNNGHGFTGNIDPEVSIQERTMDKIVLKTPKSNDGGDKLKMVSQEALHYNKEDKSNVENGESEAAHLEERCMGSPDDTCSKGGKKVKHKQKTLPLSVCNLRDKVNLKEDLKSGSLPEAGEETSKAIRDGKIPLPEECLGSVERTSLWRCQSFKTATTLEQNKVSQS